MGLFSSLFKKKSDVEAAKNVAQAPASQAAASPAPPIGQPDHAPQPIAPEPAGQNPIAAAVEQQAGGAMAPREATPIPLQVPEISTRSPEEMCGIDPAAMDRDAIRAHLAVLYRRHNAAAASLDAKLRAEAELMLDAIVACREKYIEAS